MEKWLVSGGWAGRGQNTPGMPCAPEGTEEPGRGRREEVQVGCVSGAREPAGATEPRGQGWGGSSTGWMMAVPAGRPESEGKARESVRI